MRTHIFTGALGTIWANLVTGIVYVYFGNAIGMTQLQWGILGAISMWVIAAQLLGAYIGERGASRKVVWFWQALGDRFSRLVGIVGAYLLWRAGHPFAYLALIVMICVGSFLGNMATGPWFGWFAAIIPREAQGTFWGRRDSWISLAVIIVTVPSGLIMDLIPREGKLGTAAAILVAASVIGLSDILIHGKIPEPRSPRGGTKGSLALILKPLRDRRFRPWLLFNAWWYFGWYFGASLCNLYFMENLGFKNNLLGGMIAINGVGLIGSMLTARRAGKLVDRVGIQRVLFLSHLGWSALPLVWLLATPSTAVLWVGFASLVGGVFPIAANNAAIKLVTRYPPVEEVAMYMAVSSTVANISGGLASLAAGGFLQAVGPWSFSLGRLVVSAFPMLFIASAIVRLVSVIVLVPRVHERGVAALDRRRLLLPMFFGLPAVTERTETRSRVDDEEEKGPADDKG
jgi:MFS family permease